MDYMGFIDNIEYFKRVIDNCKINEPQCLNLENLLKDIRNEVYIYENSEDDTELLNILDNMLLKALCWVHDKVATKDYYPKLTPVPYEVDEDEIALKICTLLKPSKEPLGATIKSLENKNKQNEIIVARIMNGGSIDRSKILDVGDHIIKINEIQTSNLEPKDVISHLSPADGVLRLTVKPYDCYQNENISIYTDSPCCDCQNKQSCSHSVQNQFEKFYVRVLFNYNPLNDIMHPCPEAGLRLYSGDILEICNWQDENWWQGRLLSSLITDNSPSLIAIANVLESLESNICQNQNQKCVALLVPSKKVQENTFFSLLNENPGIISEITGNSSITIDDAENIIPLTYEELCVFDPIYQYPRKRPIVLLFALNDEIINSPILLKTRDLCNENLTYFQKQLSEIIDFFLSCCTNVEYKQEESDQDFLFRLPNLYRTSNSNHIQRFLMNNNKSQKNGSPATAPSSPCLGANRIETYNPFMQLVESSFKMNLTKEQWEEEIRNANLVPTSFDDFYMYKLEELWQTFLNNPEQLVIQPTIEATKMLRESTFFGKLCFYTLINVKDLLVVDSICNNPSTNGYAQSPKLGTPKHCHHKHSPLINKTGRSVNHVKHLFDLYLDPSNQIDSVMSQLKTSILKINEMPSFVLK